MERNCPIENLSAYCLSNVFQFLDAKEMLKYSTVSKQFKQTHNIDFLWKILSVNQSMFINKRKKETWKDSYIRHMISISKNMKGGYIDSLGESVFTYQICPLREHKEIIKQVEIFDYIVIALDEKGIISLSYISIKDPEEHKSYKIEEYEGRNVTCFNFSVEKHNLFVIDSKLNISLYNVEIDEEKEE